MVNSELNGIIDKSVKRRSVVSAKNRMNFTLQLLHIALDVS
jgi:hypothetical protein